MLWILSRATLLWIQGWFCFKKVTAFVCCFENFFKNLIAALNSVSTMDYRRQWFFLKKEREKVNSL